MKCEQGYKPCIRCNGGKSNMCGIDQNRIGEFKPRNWRGDEVDLNCILRLCGRKQNAKQRRRLRDHLRHFHHDGYETCDMCQWSRINTNVVLEIPISDW